MCAPVQAKQLLRRLAKSKAHAARTSVGAAGAVAPEGMYPDPASISACACAICAAARPVWLSMVRCWLRPQQAINQLTHNIDTPIRGNAQIGMGVQRSAPVAHRCWQGRVRQVCCSWCALCQGFCRHAISVDMPLKLVWFGDALILLALIAWGKPVAFGLWLVVGRSKRPVDDGAQMGESCSITH